MWPLNLATIFPNRWNKYPWYNCHLRETARSWDCALWLVLKEVSFAPDLFNVWNDIPAIARGGSAGPRCGPFSFLNFAHYCPIPLNEVWLKLHFPISPILQVNRIKLMGTGTPHKPVVPVKRPPNSVRALEPRPCGGIAFYSYCSHKFGSFVPPDPALAGNRHTASREAD